MTNNQEREQKIVSSFMTEAIRIVPDLKAVFAEVVDDDESKSLRLCVKLPPDIGIMSDSTYKLQELAESFAEKAEQPMHLSFNQVRQGGELIVLDLPADLKADDSQIIDLTNLEIEKRVEKDLPAHVTPRHSHLLLQLALAAVSLIVIFFFWTNAAPREDMVTVVYAIRDLEKGSVYTENDLKEKRVEFSQAPISFMSAATHGVGKKAPRNIRKNQILSELDVDPLPDDIKNRLEPPPPGSGISGSNANSVLYDSLVEDGRNNLKSGKYEDALKSLNSAVDLKPEAIEGLYVRAITNRSWSIADKPHYVSHFNQANEDFKAIANLKPESMADYYHRSLAFKHLGKVNESAKDRDFALKHGYEITAEDRQEEVYGQ